MKKTLIFISLIVTIVGFNSCISFQPVALDTAADNDPYYKINNVKDADYVEKFTATSIFTDVLNNTWGFEKDACREFVVVDSVKKEGTSSLYMSWDNSKKGCDWIGGAFAWNNWQSVDMTTVIDSWALRFWVRAKKGTMKTLPIGMSFLDEGDKGSETVFISSKFIDGGKITEEWTEVIVPLTYFRCKSKGMNISGITQLIVSFSGKAQIYLDELQFVDLASLENYSPNYSAPKDDFSANSDFTQFDLFTDMVIGGTWGFEKDACREFTVDDNIKKNGYSSLHLKWSNGKDCGWIGAGWAWNNWQTVDMSKVVDTWGLHFWVRTENDTLDEVPLKMNFTDGDDKSTNSIAITNRFFEGNTIDKNWKEVIIPLTYFGFRAKGLDVSRINQLIIAFQGSNSIYIDDLQFIDLSNVKGFNEPFTATNVFTDTLTNAWGFNNDECRTFKTVNSVKKNGTSSLLLQWDTSVKFCDIVSMGFLWNNWKPVNATSILDTYALHFWVRATEGEISELPMDICLTDIANITSKTVAISNKYYDGNTINENWKEVTIPLTEFKCKEEGLNLFEINQLVFNLINKGSIYIDDIQFVKIK